MKKNREWYLGIYAVILILAVSCPNPTVESYSYTVSFDSQGADTPASPDSMTVSNPAKTLATFPAIPLKTGYGFCGWWTEPNGGGTEFTATTTVTGNITVYAKWQSGGFLKSLSPGIAGLTPDFNPAIQEYTLSVPYQTASLTIVAESMDNNDTISYSHIQPMNLAVGGNVLSINVSYGDNEETREYTITITRNKLEFVTSLINESFEDAFPPTNWSVINNGGNAVWIQASLGNYTGGTGKYADANSDLAGSGTTMDTDLRTPVLSFSGIAKPALSFQTYYRHLGTSRAYVDISTDSGSTWTTLKQYNATTAQPHYECIMLDSYAGQATVIIRFRYVSPGWNWFWRVDDVKIGDAGLN